jgi:UDP-glucose 4-epimerase
MTDRPVLVTGAAGFIGSNLVLRLLEDGRRVIGVDDLSTGSLSNLDEARERHAGSFEFNRLDVRQGGLTRSRSGWIPRSSTTSPRRWTCGAAWRIR